MGLAPRKGCIEVGADADFTILDMKAAWTVGKESLATDAGYSIYEGHEMSCKVRHTLVRGRFVVRDDALQQEAVGTGRFVGRTLTATK
jgi:dihydroorotase-like cyclic amidohydrolase